MKSWSSLNAPFAIQLRMSCRKAFFRAPLFCNSAATSPRRIKRSVASSALRVNSVKVSPGKVSAGMMFAMIFTRSSSCIDLPTLPSASFHAVHTLLKILEVELLRSAYGQIALIKAFEQFIFKYLFQCKHEVAARAFLHPGHGRLFPSFAAVADTARSSAGVRAFRRTF